MKAEAAQKYKSRTDARTIFKERKKQEVEDMVEDPLEEMFHTK